MQYQKIWDKILNSNEDVKYEFSVGERYLAIRLTSWIVFSIILLSIWWKLLPVSIFIIIFAIIGFYYTKNSNAYAFTNKRILIHKGWLSTIATSINYDKITEVSVVEPFFARVISGTGELIIHTGNVVDGVGLEHLENPYEIKKKLDVLRNIQ